MIYQSISYHGFDQYLSIVRKDSVMFLSQLLNTLHTHCKPEPCHALTMQLAPLCPDAARSLHFHLQNLIDGTRSAFEGLPESWSIQWLQVSHFSLRVVVVVVVGVGVGVVVVGKTFENGNSQNWVHLR